MKARNHFAQIAMCLNLSVWLWFWGWFFAVSHPYPQPIGALEDRPPRNVVLLREAGIEGSLEPRYVALIPSLPSWLVAHKVGEKAWAAEYGSHTRTHLGTSIGGYVLIATTALSFLQWYIVALIFGFTRRGRAG